MARSQIDSNPPDRQVGRDDDAHARWTILICDDDDVFDERIGAFLAPYGFRTERVRSLGALMRRIADGGVDALLVSLAEFGPDLAASVAKLRRSYAGPILLLADQHATVDTVLALEAGADDLVDKSVGERELLARLRTIDRRWHTPFLPARTGRGDANVVASAFPASGQDGCWTVSHLRREVVAPDGRALDLTAAEYEVLTYLAEHRGQLVTRAELFALRAEYGSVIKRSRAIDGVMSRLRAILAPHLEGRTVIHSVRGRGYVFTGFDLVKVGGLHQRGHGSYPVHAVAHAYGTSH